MDQYHGPPENDAFNPTPTASFGPSSTNKKWAAELASGASKTIPNSASQPIPQLCSKSKAAMLTSKPIAS